MTARRAKIVATVGPACGDEETLEKLIAAGADIIRLDFSKGTHESHAVSLDRVRAASRHLVKAVAVLQDLEGERVRIGPLETGHRGVLLERGAQLVITAESTVLGNANLVSTSYSRLAEDVRPGDRLLIDDGVIELEVLAAEGKRVRTEVVEGGLLPEHGNIHVPGLDRDVSPLCEKDRSDMVFGLAHGVDAVAFSSLSRAEDVAFCREEMMRAGRLVPVVAKIEGNAALENVDALIAAADGIMLARGGFAVEIPPERVPSLKRKICEKARSLGKPVIMASQMLSSMIDSPRPTRAEASEVANAVWDGADAVGLSDETALGQFPLQSLQMMDRIVSEAEQASFEDRGVVHEPGASNPAPFPLVTARAACEAARKTGAVAICCYTASGATAGLLSRVRPTIPIVAFSPEQSVRRRIALHWGVLPRIIEAPSSPELLAERVSDRLVEERLARPGDKIVLVYGSPLGSRGETNTIRLHEVLHPSERGHFA